MKAQAGVQQRAVQHAAILDGEGEDHDRVLRALGLVHCERIRECNLEGQGRSLT